MLLHLASSFPRRSKACLFAERRLSLTRKAHSPSDRLPIVRRLAVPNVGEAPGSARNHHSKEIAFTRPERMQEPGDRHYVLRASMRHYTGVQVKELGRFLT